MMMMTMMMMYWFKIKIKNIHPIKRESKGSMLNGVEMVKKSTSPPRPKDLKNGPAFFFKVGRTKRMITAGQRIPSSTKLTRTSWGNTATGEKEELGQENIRKHAKKNSEIFGCSAVPSKWLGLDDKGTNEKKRCVLPNTGEIKRLASNQKRGSTVRDILQTWSLSCLVD